MLSCDLELIVGVTVWSLNGVIGTFYLQRWKKYKHYEQDGWVTRFIFVLSGPFALAGIFYWLDRDKSNGPDSDYPGYQ